MVLVIFLFLYTACFTQFIHEDTRKEGNNGRLASDSILTLILNIQKYFEHIKINIHICSKATRVAAIEREEGRHKMMKIVNFVPFAIM